MKKSHFRCGKLVVAFIIAEKARARGRRCHLVATFFRHGHLVFEVASCNATVSAGREGDFGHGYSHAVIYDMRGNLRHKGSLV
jgi:hypothetical protein